MPKIQNSPKHTKEQANNIQHEPKTNRLDTNTVCVEQHQPKESKSFTIKRNRTNFLKDKNTGKTLWTKKEVELYEKAKETNQKRNLKLPLKTPRHSFCGCRVQTDFVSIESKKQINHKNEVETQNFITGNAQCKEIWRCPSCSMKLLKGRAKEIYNLAEQHQNKGYKMGFVTLTIRHNKNNSLEQSLDKLLANYRKFQSHKYFRQLKKTFLLGQVKALETTYTEKNGWHPHLHILFFYKSNTNNFIKFTQQKLIEDWATYTNGLLKSQNQKVVYSKDGVSKYLTKWDAITELTNDHNKTGKGVKPFQFLTAITKNQFLFETKNSPINRKQEPLENSIKQTKKLWIHYIETIKGKRRIIISRKLLQTYNLKSKTDEELVSETEHGTKIVSFSKDSWNLIYKNNLQPQLLYICDTNTNSHRQQKEILKYLQKFDNVYLDKREWDIHKPSDEPIIRLNTEKILINDWNNFIENRLV